jgi:hypothetical protein
MAARGELANDGLEVAEVRVMQRRKEHLHEDCYSRRAITRRFLP